MAPQGLGAMISMPLAGRITDKVGAYRVVPIGVVAVILGTIAYTQVTINSSEVLLAFALFVRGLGLGFSMMPSMSAAYQTLEPHQVPRATTTINIVRQVGGSLGTAVLAVILQREIVSSVGGHGGGGSVLESTTAIPAAARAQVASAFGHSFWWAVGLSALGVIPALLLPRIRPGSKPPAGKGEDPATALVAEPV